MRKDKSHEVPLGMTMHPIFQRQISAPISSIQSQLDSLKGNADVKLQNNFSFLKAYKISTEEMNEVLFSLGIFDQFERRIMKQPQNSSNTDKLVKMLIRKGSDACYAFIKELVNQGKTDLLEVISAPQIEIDQQYPKFTKEFLDLQRTYIVEMISISTILDMLLERMILTTHDHDEVQEKKRRSDKKEHLLYLLLSKPTDDWITPFLHILWMTGQKHLLDELQKRHHETEGTMRNAPKATIDNNKIKRLGNTRPLAEYVIHITSEAATQHADSTRMETLDIDNVLQECLNAEILEYWYGSIYFLLCTKYPDVVDKLLNGLEDSRILEFLQQLFQRNQSLIQQFGTENVLQLELEEKDSDSFLDEQYGKRWKQLEKKYYTDDCTECMQSTIVGNYKDMIDEIEDDIIDDTLSAVEGASEYIKAICLSENKSRVEKARCFLQYVLSDEMAILKFRESLRKRSEVSWQTFKCKTCSGDLSVVEPRKIKKKMIFKFSLKVDYDGKVRIKEESNSDKVQPLLPKVPTRKIQRSQSEGIMWYHLQDVNNFETELADSRVKRIVLLGKTELLGSFHEHGSLNPTSKSITVDNHTLNVYSMPSLHKMNAEAAKRCLQVCVAVTSPGPHAFVVILGNEELPDLQTYMEPYVFHLGERIWNYLILVVAYMGNRYDSIPERVHVPETIPYHIEDRCIIVKELHSDSLNIYRRLVNRLVTMTEETKEFYTDDVYEKTEKIIQEKTKLIVLKKAKEILQLKEQIYKLKNGNPREEATQEVYGDIIQTDIERGFLFSF